MRTRPVLAVAVTAGLVLGACSNPEESTSVDAASETPTQVSTAASITEDTISEDEPLVLEVEDSTDRTGAATASSDTSSTESDETSTTAAPTTDGSTTAAPTTATPTTAAPTTSAATSTVAPTTTTSIATTTTQPASMLETRAEILNLALPKYGGGTFSPDSMAGKNVVLWFWGAH